jgi:hypothetical protein
MVISSRTQAEVHFFVSSVEKPLQHKDDYTKMIAELRNLQQLTLQLPDVVSFPLFAVKLALVNREISRRIDHCLYVLLSSFESALLKHTTELCDEFHLIHTRIQQDISSASDLVSIEQFKGDLIVRIIDMQHRMDFNRRSLYFLVM